MSNMYSLLNYIAATSKEIYESSSASQVLNNPLYPSASLDHATLHSVATGIGALSEDEKRLVGISTISVVSRLALEFNMEEVGITFSIRQHDINHGFVGNEVDHFDASATSQVCRADSGGCHCL
jgi:hypothetical protein